MADPGAPDPESAAGSVDGRVKAALARREAARQAELALAARAGANRGAGAAWRIMIDFVVATALGGAIGLGLDRWAGIAPWGMVAGIFLGFGVGMWAAVRAASALQQASAPASKGPGPGSGLDGNG